MRLEDVRRVLDAVLLTGNYDPSFEVQAGCGADLLSDVLAFTHSGSLLLTGLTNVQVLVTAEVAGIVAVVLVRGKRPPSETIQAAEQRDIPLLGTHYSMFEACGRLYTAGLVGCDRRLPPQRRPAPTSA